MTLEAVGPITVYVDRGDGARLIGVAQRLAIQQAILDAGNALEAATSATFTAIVAGEEAVKLLKASVVIRAPRIRETSFSVENVRRSKGERKRNRKQRWSR